MDLDFYKYKYYEQQKEIIDLKKQIEQLTKELNTIYKQM